MPMGGGSSRQIYESKKKKTAAQIAAIAKKSGDAGRAARRRWQAANTGGLGPRTNSGGGGGGGGGAAAPVSTLAGLPKSALLDTLVKNGLIKEGMPPEQSLAILKYAQLREGVPINVEELMKLVSADYAKTTGDITTAGQEWMHQLLGTAAPITPQPGWNYENGQWLDEQGNLVGTAPVEDAQQIMPAGISDPNAAMFYQDPIFSSYAGGLAQMDETADTNEATDLAWFRKEQEAQETYYNDMMNAISTGTLPVGAAAAGGGGGGGGGGGRGGGGYGGGGGGGSGDASDLRTTLTNDETSTETARDKVLETNPGFRTDMLNYAAQFGPEVADQIEEILNLTPSGRGQDVLAALEEAQLNMDTQNATYEDIQENNRMWGLNQPAEFRRLLDQYEQMTGLSLGDDPNMPGEQAFHYAERTGDDPRTIDEVEGPENKYTYGPADTALLPQDQRDQVLELQELLEPALLGATGNNVNDPANISKAANAVGYLQSLAKNKLVSDASGGITSAINDLGTTSTGELVTDPDTGISSPAAPTSNPFAQIIAQVAGQIGQSAGTRGAVVSGQPPSPSSAPYTDPNIVQPPGSEVQNTPENNLAYYQLTGNLPMTPVTDDPFPDRPPRSEIALSNPVEGGQSGQGSWHANNARPTLDANLIAQIIGGAAKKPNYPFPNVGGPPAPPPTNSGYGSWEQTNQLDLPPLAHTQGGGYGSWNYPKTQPGRNDLLALLGQTSTTPQSMADLPQPDEYSAGSPASYEDFVVQGGAPPITTPPTTTGPPSTGNIQFQTSGNRGDVHVIDANGDPAPPGRYRPDLGDQMVDANGNVVSTPSGNMPGIGALAGRRQQQNTMVSGMQQLAQRALQNRPQENTPSDPTSDIARAIAGARSLAQATQPNAAPTELPDIAGALQDPEALRTAQRDRMVEEFEDLGYSGEDAENYRYNWNGMNVSPETMREHYLQQALLNQPSWGNPEGSGLLKDVVGRLMQSRSLAQLVEDTPTYTAEDRRNFGEEGEYYKKDAGITDEQYAQNKNFAQYIPNFQDYINTGGSMGTGMSYNPNAGAATIFSDYVAQIRDQAKVANQQRFYTDPNEADPQGIYGADEMPFAIEDYINTAAPEEDLYDSTVTMGMSGLGGAPSWGNLGNTPTSAATNIADIMKKSAASLKLPPTVQKPVTPVGSWSSGMKRGTGAAGGGVNRAAQGASAVAKLAKVLKGFK